MSAEIEKLKAEVGRLKDDLYAAEVALKNAIIAEGGFSEGEVVEARNTYRHGPWQPAIIRKITTGWLNDRCHYVVSFKKKNGDWSKVNLGGYDVEIRKPE